MKYSLYVFQIFILVMSVAAKAQPPEWLINHMEYMTQGSGIWIADNSEYKNDQEPVDAYATEWKWGLGKHSLTGRLYGIKDGKEIGSYWEFRTFWNPVEEKAYAYQFGASCAVGMGEVTFTDEGVMRIDQTFYNPDGTTARVGHESKDLSGIHETRAFDINEKGEWIERRFYRWKQKES